jgi:general secretion pathway protein A
MNIKISGVFFLKKGMYEAYWGLKEKPFENTPDPKFLYSSHEHLEAVTRMTYAIEERKGAALLTGDYGCGKTLISRRLFEMLPQEKYEVALVTNPLLSPTEIIREICNQLGIKTSPTWPKTQLLMELNDRLYQNMRSNKDTVIIVDEGQSIKDMRSLEELRLLLNFQLNDRFLLTLIIMGQPELRDMIDKYKQLKQRLAIRYHLNPLSNKDSKEYILHRLEIAGAKNTIFANNVHDIIWQNSGGVPREINTICDMCLLLGFTKKAKGVKADLVRKAISGLDH